METGRGASVLEKAITVYFWLFLDRYDGETYGADSARELIRVNDGWSGIGYTAFFAVYSRVEMITGYVCL